MAKFVKTDGDGYLGFSYDDESVVYASSISAYNSTSDYSAITIVVASSRHEDNDLVVNLEKSDVPEFVNNLLRIAGYKVALLRKSAE